MVIRPEDSGDAHGTRTPGPVLHLQGTQREISVDRDEEAGRRTDTTASTSAVEAAGGRVCEHCRDQRGERAGGAAGGGSDLPERVGDAGDMYSYVAKKYDHFYSTSLDRREDDLVRAAILRATVYRTVRCLPITMLDIGCGTGHALELALTCSRDPRRSARVCSYYGVDASAEMLGRFGKHNTPSIHRCLTTIATKCSLAHEVDYEGLCASEVDLVTALWCLDYFNPTDLGEMLRRIAPVTKTGARFVATIYGDCYRNSTDYVCYGKDAEFGAPARALGGHEVFIEIAQRSGWVVDRVKPLTGIWQRTLNPRFYGLAGLVDRLACPKRQYRFWLVEAEYVV